MDYKYTSIRIEQSLYEWSKEYAKKNYKSYQGLITELLNKLKKKEIKL